MYFVFIIGPSVKITLTVRSVCLFALCIQNFISSYSIGFLVSFRSSSKNVENKSWRRLLSPIPGSFLKRHLHAIWEKNCLKLGLIIDGIDTNI